MSQGIRFSIIVPVYNRPQEIDELLASLTQQTYKNFEVLIIEDGSTHTCEKVYERYTNSLNIRYFFKPNSGPGPSRNFGYQHAVGDYFIVFDSDCLLPSLYLEKVESFLKHTPLDAWGGPDRGHKDFTYVQQAMAYTMSSLLTTGGIRGGNVQAGKFQPRSFNMGISKEVFLKTGGFKFDRYAEDIEFSLRMQKSGFQVGYIPDAYVFHKRRTNFKQFFWQVYNFGRGRVLVGRQHSGAIKLTHWFPSLFLLGIPITLIVLAVNQQLGIVILFAYIAYILAISTLAYSKTKSIIVALLAGPSAWVQLSGYGLGFLKEMFFKTVK